MSQREVETRLGKPDYVAHFDDPRTTTVWYYGCEGPNQFPTLGTVHFDAKRRVSDEYNFNYLSPPPESVIAEKELRQAMVLLDQARALDGRNPRVTVRVVNGLIPLGKTKVLAAIREYCRVLRADTEKLVLLVRVLFDIPGPDATRDGQTEPLPEVYIGQLYPPPPFDKTLAPRFPMVLMDDIPLLEISGCSLGGFPEQVTSRLAYYEKNGRLRTQPLHPTDQPWETLAHLEASSPWLFGQRYRVQKGYGPYDEKTHDFVDPAYYEAKEFERERMRELTKEQILKLLSPLYPSVLKRTPASKTRDASVVIDTTQWDAIVADLQLHSVRWNPATNEYERLNQQ